MHKSFAVLSDRQSCLTYSNVLHEFLHETIHGGWNVSVIHLSSRGAHDIPLRSRSYFELRPGSSIHRIAPVGTTSGKMNHR